MNISTDGIDLIKRFEGLRLAAYLDVAGVPTIGYGHTRTARMGQVITAERADGLLREDLPRYEGAVSNLVSGPLSQGQFDALVAFAFNVGVGALERSTLLTRVNAQDDEGAAREFTRWIYAGGRKLNGLVRRRAAEQALFLSDPAVQDPPVSAKPHDPDGPVVDVLTLQAPWRDTIATRCLLQRLSLTALVQSDVSYAVLEFQRARKLVPDGVVGPVTWRALFEG